MLARMRQRLTFANVISVIALFIALGGGAYAAVALPKNSVGSKQIKKNAVTNAKIGKNAVTGAKVKDGSLTGTDINLTTLPKVGSATNADNATHAASADNASNAANATNAGHATNADHANNADSASDSSKLGGKTIQWALVNPTGTIVSQSGGITVAAHPFPGLFILQLPTAVTGHLVSVSDAVAGDSNFRGVSIAGPCGTGGEAIDCTTLAPNGNDGSHVLVATTDATNGTEADHAFYLTVY
jgi:hypothetical protein